MMYSIPIVTTAIIALLSSNARAEEYSGNLDLCIPNIISKSAGTLDKAEEQLCLTPDGILKPTARSSEQQNYHWHYDNGLLRFASKDGTKDLCLGPTVALLSTEAPEPYQLVPQECPEHDEEEIDPAKEDASWYLSHSRYMRFLITPHGKVQSLAGVQSPDIGKDEARTHPFCLTMTKVKDDAQERAYLVPCDEEKSEAQNLFDRTEQVFDVYGTYTGSFVMPLHCAYSSTESVEIAFQTGLPSGERKDASDDINFIEISTIWPINGNDEEEHVLEVISLEGSSSSGIISLEQFDSNLDFSLDGFLTVSLKTTKGGEGDGSVLSEATVWISGTSERAAKPPKSSYLFCLYIVGGMAGCFALSVLFEKLFSKKTRTDGPGSSDGKTVCMSTEEDEEEDFPLEDKVEEGFGVIHISMGKHTASSSSDSETDLDISQFSRSRISIPDEDEL